MNSSGTECSRTGMIRAHIIPRGFARDITSSQSHNLKITASSVSKTNHGVYDSQLLCETCDNFLGEYDRYALDVFRRFPTEAVIFDDNTFVMRQVSKVRSFSVMAGVSYGPP